MSLKSIMITAIHRRREHEQVEREAAIEQAKQSCENFQSILDDFKAGVLESISKKIEQNTFVNVTKSSVLFFLNIDLHKNDIQTAKDFVQGILYYIESEGVVIANKSKLDIAFHPSREIAPHSGYYHFNIIENLDICWTDIHQKFHAQEINSSHHGIDTSRMTTDNDGTEEVKKMIDAFVETHHSHD